MGALGDGTTTDRATPVEVAGGAADWAGVTAHSASHTCAMKTNGSLYCWGLNDAGQLGDGTTTNRSTPTEVAGGATDWAQVVTGGHHTCAIKTNGRLYCWGDNGEGRLGDGTTTNRATPTEVAGGATDWTDVTAGFWHTCARKTNGRLYCWGDNLDGAVGDDTTTDRSTPTEVAGGATDWAEVTAGGKHTCARKTNSRLYCWGPDSEGQLGNGPTGLVGRDTPTEVAGGATDWVAISGGGWHACARKTDGRLYCWGSNLDGEVGDGTFNRRESPTAVAGGATDWVAISAGGEYTCALNADGRLYCWGDNDYHQLGDGSSARRLTPGEVAITYQVDAEVKRSSDSSFTGANVYNSTGSGQTVGTNVIRGSSTTYDVRLTNRSTDTDSITVQGAGSQTNFPVTYQVEGTDVTSAVVAGTYQFGGLAPGEAVTMTIQMGVDTGAAAGSRRTVVLHATSTENPTKTDAVGATVTATNPPPVYKVDGQIRRSGDPAFVGDNVYNTTGTGQKVKTDVRRRQTATFTVRFTNESTAVDTITVRGTAGVAGFRVRYFDGATEVTNQVVAGTYQLSNIPVNGSRDLEVRIKVKAGTAVGATTSALVTGTSTHDPAKVDAVKAKVRAVA